MIIFNAFTCNQNFSMVCSNRGEILARFTLMNFLHITVILCLHCSRLTFEMTSRQSLMSWDFSTGWKIPYSQSLKWSFFAKIINHFHKRLHLRAWTGSWIRLYCAGDNYLCKLSYTTLLATLLAISSGDSKLHLFQLFRFSMKPIDQH